MQVINLTQFRYTNKQEASWFVALNTVSIIDMHGIYQSVYKEI